MYLLAEEKDTMWNSSLTGSFIQANYMRYGDQYDMDRIIGIQCMDGTVKFADQDGYEMDHEMIEVQEKVNG